MKPLVVSFHTGQALYAGYARTLAESCAGLGLDCRIERLEDRGAWVENVSLKGRFLQDCMARFARPLLWIDVDGRPVAEPALLYDTTADFAIHAIERAWDWAPVGRERLSLPAAWPRALGPRWFLTGTVFVNRSPAGRELLTRWAEAAAARPRDYQQLLLQQVWCGLPELETLWLPQGYCKIDGHRWRAGEPSETVILHELASSQLGHCVRA